VHSESNRDLRLSLSLEEGARRNGSKYDKPDGLLNGPSRRKTIMGRKLRTMTVEKGLLRETKVVQKMTDALVECRVRITIYGVWCSYLISSVQFYLDDLDDELTTTTLRMLVKDLLILFQAGNEGVINVLGAS